MMGVCCCRGTLQENLWRDVGATADKLKRGLQKEGLKKGRVQKLQERGEQGAPMQVCTHPPCIPGFAQPRGQTPNKAYIKLRLLPSEIDVMWSQCHLC